MTVICRIRHCPILWPKSYCIKCYCMVHDFVLNNVLVWYMLLFCIIYKRLLWTLWYDMVNDTVYYMVWYYVALRRLYKSVDNSAVAWTRNMLIFFDIMWENVWCFTYIYLRVNTLLSWEELRPAVLKTCFQTTKNIGFLMLILAQSWRTNESFWGSNGGKEIQDISKRNSSKYEILL